MHFPVPDLNPAKPEIAKPRHLFQFFQLSYRPGDDCPKHLNPISLEVSQKMALIQNLISPYAVITLSF